MWKQTKKHRKLTVNNYFVNYKDTKSCTHNGGQKYPIGNMV